MSADRVLYARTGEEIVCDAGHVVTRLNHDIAVGEIVHGHLFEGFEHLKSADISVGFQGDPFPNCSCGAHWLWNNRFRFREGYRVIREDGRIEHLSLEEVGEQFPYRLTVLSLETAT